MLFHGRFLFFFISSSDMFFLNMVLVFRYTRT